MTPPREGANTEADSTTARTIVNTAMPLAMPLDRNRLVAWYVDNEKGAGAMRLIHSEHDHFR